jgi:hypothetical protein
MVKGEAIPAKGGERDGGGHPPMMPEEIRRLKRDLMEKVLDKAASDPVWKQRLLDDPEAAIEEAGFPESRQLREMQASLEAEEEAEVSGQWNIVDPSIRDLYPFDCLYPPHLR